MNKIAHAHRGNSEWHLVGLADDVRGQTTLRDVAHHPRLQHDAIKLRHISCRANFASCTPFDKVKDQTRQPPSCQPPRVFGRKYPAVLRHARDCLGVSQKLLLFTKSDAGPTNQKSSRTHTPDVCLHHATGLMMRRSFCGGAADVSPAVGPVFSTDPGTQLFHLVHPQLQLLAEQVGKFQGFSRQLFATGRDDGDKVGQLLLDGAKHHAAHAHGLFR